MDTDKLSSEIDSIHNLSVQQENVLQLAIIIESIRNVYIKKEKLSDLSEKILSIKQTFESHWQENYVPLAKKLKSKLYDGVPTPVLTVCGQGTREIRFTKYLSYFLDPKKDHGLGTSFLKSVFDPYADHFPSTWFDECEVIPEMWIGKHSKSGNCYCDIGIIGSNFAIILEQKIISGESFGSRVGLRQLQRYSEAVKENHEYCSKHIIKLFLTPTGKKPIKSEDWIAMSYHDIIDRGYNLLRKGNFSITARENLRCLLMDLIVGPYEDVDEMIDNMKVVSSKLLCGGYNLYDILRFSSIVEVNRMFINTLMEE